MMKTLYHPLSCSDTQPYIGGAISPIRDASALLSAKTVAVAFPLILWLNRRPFQRPVVWAVSILIFLFGLGWFIERVFDLSYMPI